VVVRRLPLARGGVPRLLGGMVVGPHAEQPQGQGDTAPHQDGGPDAPAAGRKRQGARPFQHALHSTLESRHGEFPYFAWYWPISLRAFSCASCRMRSCSMRYESSPPTDPPKTRSTRSRVAWRITLVS